MKYNVANTPSEKHDGNKIYFTPHKKVIHKRILGTSSSSQSIIFKSKTK